MAEHRKIRCAKCEYARHDKNASEYTRKKCKGCEFDCGCKSKCKCDKKCKFKHTDEICPKQRLVWKAIQCANSDSEYHRSLLNVTPNGDKQQCITWVGCEEGVVL